MTKCANCQTSILFGGVKDGPFTFCNKACRQSGQALYAIYEIPEAIVAPRLKEIFDGSCPTCGGPGPVDVRNSYLIYSVLIMTFTRTNPQLTCANCARKRCFKSAGVSMLLGWWGFPWGLIYTPFVVGRNFIEAYKRPKDAPSQTLETIVRQKIAEEGYERTEVAYPRHAVPQEFQL